jgi:hypothetical protein
LSLQDRLHRPMNRTSITGRCLVDLRLQEEADA